MKNPSKVRTKGFVFIILSSLGLLFCLTVIGLTWVIRPQIQERFVGVFTLADSTLDNTDESLGILKSVIEDSTDNLAIIQSMLGNLEDTLDSTSDSLETSAALIGNDLRLTVIDTQIALTSASASAEVIDNTLSFLDKVPLLGVNYQPDVPLHVSLDQAAGSLEDFPGSLQTIQENLTDAADDLDTLNTDLTDLSANIGDFEQDLFNAADVLSEYELIIDQIQEKFSSFQDNFPGYLTVLSIFVSVNFFWLGLAQLHILLQSLEDYQGEQTVVNLSDIQRE